MKRSSLGEYYTALPQCTDRMYNITFLTGGSKYTDRMYNITFLTGGSKYTDRMYNITFLTGGSKWGDTSGIHNSGSLQTVFIKHISHHPNSSVV